MLHINVDKFNEESLVSHRGWTPSQALTWNEQVFSELREAIANLPTDKLFGGRGPLGACQWYGMPAIIHSRGHRKEAQRNLGIEE